MIKILHNLWKYIYVFGQGHTLTSFKVKKFGILFFWFLMISFKDGYKLNILCWRYCQSWVYFLLQLQIYKSNRYQNTTVIKRASHLANWEKKAIKLEIEGKKIGPEKKDPSTWAKTKRSGNFISRNNKLSYLQLERFHLGWARIAKIKLSGHFWRVGMAQRLHSRFQPSRPGFDTSDHR